MLRCLGLLVQFIMFIVKNVFLRWRVVPSFLLWNQHRVYAEGIGQSSALNYRWNIQLSWIPYTRTHRCKSLSILLRFNISVWPLSDCSTFHVSLLVKLIWLDLVMDYGYIHKLWINQAELARCLHYNTAGCWENNLLLVILPPNKICVVR